MKKIIAMIAAAAMAAAMLSGCGQEMTPACAPITEKIISDIAIEDMALVDAERISNYLPADMDKVEEFSLYICGNGGFADEVGVFRMKDAKDTAALAQAISDRINERRDVFESYNPDEFAKLNETVINTRDRYVFYAVCSDTAAAEKIFNDSFK